MENEEEGAKVVDTEGVELGRVESAGDEGFWINEGPLARFWLSRAYVAKSGPDKVVLAGNLQWLFRDRPVIDSEGVEVGVVLDIVVADAMFDMLLVELPRGRTPGEGGSGGGDGDDDGGGDLEEQEDEEQEDEEQEDEEQEDEKDDSLVHVLPEWIERIETEVHLETPTEDVMFHQEEHTFRKQAAHFLDEHV